MKNSSKGKQKFQPTWSWLLNYLWALLGPGSFPSARNRREEAILGVTVLGILTWIMITNWH